MAEVFSICPCITTPMDRYGIPVTSSCHMFFSGGLSTILVKQLLIPEIKAAHIPMGQP